MPPSLPGKRSLFKYAAPDTVMAVLTHRTVRYSSPLSFNDPFDVQSGLHFDFDLDTLHGKFFDRVCELATGPFEPPVNANEPFGKLVRFVREKYPQHDYLRDRWKQKTDRTFAWFINEIKATQRKFQQHWWTTLLPTVRVFCVSETRDNLLMWAHYAKDHTGAAFEFLSLPDEDNALSVAQPVRYVDDPPPFFTEAEWLDDITLVRQFDMLELYRRYVFYKSRHWCYEREWRVWYPRASTSTGSYDDTPIRQSELASVIIGCKARNVSMTLRHPAS